MKANFKALVLGSLILGSLAVHAAVITDSAAVKSYSSAAAEAIKNSTLACDSMQGDGYYVGYTLQPPDHMQGGQANPASAVKVMTDILQMADKVVVLDQAKIQTFSYTKDDMVNNMDLGPFRVDGNLEMKTDANGKILTLKSVSMRLTKTADEVEMKHALQMLSIVCTAK